MFTALRDQADQEGRRLILRPKDVDNKRAADRLKGLGHRTATDVILRDLRRDSFHLSYILDMEGRVTYLWFTHKEIVETLMRNWEVLSMDATYKTNKYGLPLFEITGSTCLHTTLPVGYAFLLNETQEDFE